MFMTFYDSSWQCVAKGNTLNCGERNRVEPVHPGFLEETLKEINPILDTKIFLLLLRHAQGILKRGGLESSGQILISLNGKTKKKKIFFANK